MSAPDREQLKMELQQVNQQISQQTQIRSMEVTRSRFLNLKIEILPPPPDEILCLLLSESVCVCVQAASNSMLLQREASALSAQPAAGKWPVGGGVSSEQLSLELHHVEREIGKRTREIALVSPETGDVRGERASERGRSCLFIANCHCGFSLTQESQAAQEVQYKLKAAENGQSEHKAQLEELSLALG